MEGRLASRRTSSRKNAGTSAVYDGDRVLVRLGEVTVPHFGTIRDDGLHVSKKESSQVMACGPPFAAADRCKLARTSM